MIRKIYQEDSKVFLQMVQEFYDSPAVLHPVQSENFKKTLQAALDNSPYLRIYLIEEDEKPAGYCQLSISWSNEAGGIVVWVEELYIRPEFQGKGLGGKCLQFICDEFPDAARLRLEISPDNDGAKRLYQRNGYEILDYVQMINDIKDSGRN